MGARIRRFVEGLARAPFLPEDSDDEQIRKATLVLAPLMIVVLAVVWVGVYARWGLYVSAAIPFAYQVVTVAGVVWVARTKRVAGFRRLQLGLMLVLPFALQWSLGGFGESSAVCLWALVSPLGAVLFQGGREAVPWFAGFLALLAFSAAIDGVLPTDADALPTWLSVAFFALNLGGVALTTFLMIQYFLHALGAERERSERLLLNVLPAPIARRLKQEHGVIAERSDDVSVLFADLTGFTPAAERVAPEAVIGLLDDVFSVFDSLVEERALEKIKTIGDGYMVAGGIPTPSPNHLERVADLALAMRRRLSELPAAQGLALRVGIDVGPVVAGVIGRTKFGYDLWGDTVNTASRMESHAPPGEIQVTVRAYERLASRFDFERRDQVDVKGKGEMTTYLLVGPRPAGGEPESLRPSTPDESAPVPM